MKTVAYFNNKGSVGKTTLVYHLAWMFADRGINVLAVDLDPQANLTSMFLDDNRLLSLWEGDERTSISDCIKPLMDRTGDIQLEKVEKISEHLSLIPGNLELSRFEDLLSDNWPRCLDRKTDAFRVMSAFHRVIEIANQHTCSEIILIDVGPNLGAINRAALISAEHIELPLSPDLYSLQGMKNLGPTLSEWRKDWKERLNKAPKDIDFSLPNGNMIPDGYILMQHGVRESRPVIAYQRWIDRIPAVYRVSILDEVDGVIPPVTEDPNLLAMMRHYRSLMPLAMDAHKPMFFLKSADGAFGAHVEAVDKCYKDFLFLAKRIAEKNNIEIE